MTFLPPLRVLTALTLTCMPTGTVSAVWCATFAHGHSGTTAGACRLVHVPVLYHLNSGSSYRTSAVVLPPISGRMHLKSM